MFDKFTSWFQPQKVKQGIPAPPHKTHEQLHPEEYETYVDPNCGCTKTRRKKIRKKK